VQHAISNKRVQPFRLLLRLFSTNPFAMKKSIVLTLILLGAVRVFPQKEKLNPFTAVEAFGPFQIELIASDREGIEIEPVNVDLDDLTIEVRRGELRLKLQSRHYLSDWNSDKFRKSQLIKTKIYFKQLEAVQASAGAKVTSTETLRAKKFEAVGNMGAEVRLSVVAETVYAKSSMGSTVTLNGRTEFLEVKAAMGGILKASKLESKSAYVKASMGSEVSIFASDEIDIDSNFGADVRYSGDPVVRHTNRKMGGEIRER
jgi:Putative auto-transporter adhesin, head GIN domain